MDSSLEGVAYVKHVTAERVVIGCNETGNSFALTCEQGRWIGVETNCSGLFHRESSFYRVACSLLTVVKISRGARRPLLELVGAKFRGWACPQGFGWACPSPLKAAYGFIIVLQMQMKRVQLRAVRRRESPSVCRRSVSATLSPSFSFDNFTAKSYTVFICQQSYLLLLGIPSPP